MPPTLVRPARITGVFACVLAILWLRFSAGLVRATEVDAVVHWALLALGLLLATGAGALEANAIGSIARRDTLFGLGAALIVFSALRFGGAV